MAKLFLFAIGGTGSRVVKALAMLMASGVKIENTDSIIPIIIDPDSSNGDLTRTVDILKVYKSIREKSYSEKSDFFKTKFLSLDELGQGGFVSNNYKFDIEGVNDCLFKDFIGFSELDTNNKAFISMLFSKKNLDADMDLGFKGNPNIGSVVLNKIKDSDSFVRFAENFEENDRIFIISSIFGGTGAAGFPLILKNIRDAKEPLPRHSYLNSAKIGAVSVLPYFVIKRNDATQINSDTFISKTKAALQYYSRNVSGNNSINALYYIGDRLTNEQEGCDGAAEQKNKAHFVELASALAIVDFMGREGNELVVRNGRATDPLYFEFGIKDETSDIKFSNLSQKTYDMIAHKLTKYALFRAFMDYHYETLSMERGESWANNGTNKLKSDALDSRFKENLKSFNLYFKEWIVEMQESNISFNALDMNKKDRDIFQLVIGEAEKKNFVGNLFKGTGISNYRNKLSSIEPTVDFLNNHQKLFALFSLASEEIVAENISR